MSSRQNYMRTLAHVRESATHGRRVPNRLWLRVAQHYRREIYGA